MFDLIRKLGHRDHDAGQATEREQTAGQAKDGSQIRLLAITQNANDWKSLHVTSKDQGWLLFWAHSGDAALAMLSRHAIPIVICDRDLPGHDWKTMLKRISLAQPTSILLASNVSDEYLWREVVQHEGYDVLPKPFQPERLVRMVTAAWAWRDWRGDSQAHREGR